MRLVYFSPVPWASFSQRPHKFVEWFHAKFGEPVLWVDPYPTRFPMLSDRHRLKRKPFSAAQKSPPWLEVIRPKALPIEPFPLSELLNGLLWHATLKRINDFAQKQPALLAVGKPSVLALAALRELSDVPSIYDGMDDFPAFYSGVSRWAMSRRELQLVRKVTHVFTSSTLLQRRWGHIRGDVQLVRNGLDASLLPNPRINVVERSKKIFGYVGTLGSWFDWNWIDQLAQLRPSDTIRLIGPILAAPPISLANNIELMPACAHSDALNAMLDFDIGLIPFKNNDLTASVDPIKYYEYRALGLPVLSTAFGEMVFRNDEEGTFLSSAAGDLSELVTEALSYRPDPRIIQEFKMNNSWEAHFNAAKLM